MEDRQFSLCSLFVVVSVIAAGLAVLRINGFDSRLSHLFALSFVAFLLLWWSVRVSR